MEKLNSSNREYFLTQWERDAMKTNQKKPTKNKKFSFEQAIKELEDYFVRKDKKKLYRFILAKVEKPLIEYILNETRGNKLKAAKILGINRNTLYSKIKKLGIEATRWKEC
jgi:DNA-binding protein Fis